MLLGIAHKNNNFELIKKVYNFFNNNIDNYFVNSEKDEDLYSSIFNTFCNFINYLKPKFQNQYISKYQSHLIKNLEINSIKDFKNLTLISCTLFENNKFNEVVNLLTAAFKIVSYQAKVFILSECEFTLASARAHLDRNEEALKYIALAYKHSPENPNVLCLYLAQDSRNRHLIPSIVNDLPNSSLKTLLSASFRIKNISTVCRIAQFLKHLENI